MTDPYRTPAGKTASPRRLFREWISYNDKVVLVKNTSSALIRMNQILSLTWEGKRDVRDDLVGILEMTLPSQRVHRYEHQWYGVTPEEKEILETDLFVFFGKVMSLVPGEEDDFIGTIPTFGGRVR